MNSKENLAYLCFYMHKMYLDIEKIQDWKTPNCDTDYYIHEKLNAFLTLLEQKGITEFRNDVAALELKDFKDLYYTNIA